MKYYIYVMVTKNNKVIYVGVTNDLQRRVSEHKSGKIEGFTKRYCIHKLVYAEEYASIKDAIKREKQIKSWSRQRKNDLVESINPNWEEILPF